MTKVANQIAALPEHKSYVKTHKKTALSLSKAVKDAISAARTGVTLPSGPVGIFGARF